jgi:hypothetical protein
LSALLDNIQYPIVIKSKTTTTTIIQIKYGGIIIQIKYGGKTVVCQPGTADVAKSKENGIVTSIKAREAKKGI